MRIRAYSVAVLAVLALLVSAAGAPDGVRLDNWEAYPAGRLDLAGTCSRPTTNRCGSAEP
jgi:hypothetical protein